MVLKQIEQAAQEGILLRANRMADSAARDSIKQIKVANNISAMGAMLIKHEDKKEYMDLVVTSLAAIFIQQRELAELKETLQHSQVEKSPEHLPLIKQDSGESEVDDSIVVNPEMEGEQHG